MDARLTLLLSLAATHRTYEQYLGFLMRDSEKVRALASSRTCYLVAEARDCVCFCGAPVFSRPRSMVSFPLFPARGSPLIGADAFTLIQASSGTSSASSSSLPSTPGTSPFLRS